MPYDSFLMKKLLKSEIYGSSEQCTGSTCVHRNVKNHGSTMREQYSTVHLSPKAETRAKRTKEKKKCKRRFI